MMESVPTEPMAQVADTAPAAMSYRIKRVGARPLQFSGSELGMAMSFTPGQEFWYEINIYRTVEQEFVVAVKQFFQSADRQDRAQAWKCPDFEAVMDTLESYDAGNDVDVIVGPMDGKPAAELAAVAHDLQAQVGFARQQYAGLVGAMLHEIENA